MTVLNIDRPDFMKDEDIVIFEDAVGKFFDEHAPASRTARRAKSRSGRSIPEAGRSRLRK